MFYFRTTNRHFAEKEKKNIKTSAQTFGLSAVLFNPTALRKAKLYTILAILSAIGLILFNPTALRKDKIAYNFGHSECNRVNSV